MLCYVHIKAKNVSLNLILIHFWLIAFIREKSVNNLLWHNFYLFMLRYIFASTDSKSLKIVIFGKNKLVSYRHDLVLIHNPKYMIISIMCLDFLLNIINISWISWNYFENENLCIYSTWSLNNFGELIMSISCKEFRESVLPYLEDYRSHSNSILVSWLSFLSWQK